MNGEERFGYSLALEDGDIHFDLDPLSGLRTLRLVEGKRNLLQALALRVITPLGSDPFNVTYGLDGGAIFTQPAGVRLTKELIKLNLVRTLGTDARVREVREILFEDDPAYLERHPEITLEAVNARRSSRIWMVEVTLETISGEVETLAAQVGG